MVERKLWSKGGIKSGVKLGRESHFSTRRSFRVRDFYDSRLHLSVNFGKWRGRWGNECLAEYHLVSPLKRRHVTHHFSNL